MARSVFARLAPASPPLPLKRRPIRCVRCSIAFCIVNHLRLITGILLSISWVVRHLLHQVSLLFYCIQGGAISPRHEYYGAKGVYNVPRAFEGADGVPTGCLRGVYRVSTGCLPGAYAPST